MALNPIPQFDCLLDDAKSSEAMRSSVHNQHSPSGEDGRTMTRIAEFQRIPMSHLCMRCRTCFATEINRARSIGQFNLMTTHPGCAGVPARVHRNELRFRMPIDGGNQLLNQGRLRACSQKGMSAGDPKANAARHRLHCSIDY